LKLIHLKAKFVRKLKYKKIVCFILFYNLVFSQGDEGKSWYIILKGSVQCIIYGKGVVGTLHEGDDFGKLSLVNNSPRLIIRTNFYIDSFLYFCKIEQQQLF
jgi:Rap guanine nucleotide exchange factor 4